MKNKKELEIIHKKLQKHLENQKENWKSFVYAQDKGFYQGLEEIDIDGWRPSENRLKKYNIDKYLLKEKTALDIGCNCGFFTIVVSRHVKHIEGLDINPYLINIANDVKDFLEINNASFCKSSFEDYNIVEKFDIIFSLGNDETIDGNTKFMFSQYIEKIYSILAHDGILIFESQAIDAYYAKAIFQPKLEKLETLFEILENKIVEAEYPINVPNRIFLILKKKKIGHD